MAIKATVLERIKGHTQLKNKIALATNRSVYSVSLWIKNNDARLTMASALKAIREEFDLSDEEILEAVEVD
jgi:hypothetical protein